MNSKGQIQILALLLILLTFGIFAYEAYQSRSVSHEEIEMPAQGRKCAIHSDCEENESCEDNICQEISCKYCGYTEDHQCKSYECCSNADCDDDDSETADKCINSRTKDAKCEHEIIQRCEDGTIYGQCSTDKPKYCDNGDLIDKCSICGCSLGQICQEDETCIESSGPQCVSGPCCDISINTFKTSTYKCQENVDIEYDCPWGNDPGDDVGARHQHRYCSGTLASCEGDLKWSDWSIHEDCTSNEACVDGSCVALTCSDGTLYSQCSSNKPKYCDNGDLVDKCSVCGCPAGKQCEEDETCIESPGSQCTSGPCCDTSTNTFRPSAYKCQESVDTEYGCPWGTSSGNDVGARYQDRYCSGSSAVCNGSLEWSDWVVVEDCASNETCSGAACVPLVCSDGTPWGQCSSSKPLYCDGGNLINKCSACGCGPDQLCQADETCKQAEPAHVVPVLVLNYFPDKNNDGKIDPEITDLNYDLDFARTKVVRMTNEAIEALEQGSTYHGYKNPNATLSLDYSLYETKEFIDPVPLEDGSHEVVDGDFETGKWAPTPPFTNDYLIVDLLANKQIDSITLHFYSADRPEKFHIDASFTGSFSGEEQRLVTELDGVSGNATREYSFDAIETRHLKLVVDIYREGQPDESHQINLYEFGVSYSGVVLDISNASLSADDGFRVPAPAHHMRILNGLNICNYVENLGIKEVWIWMYHTDRAYPVESYMRGPYAALGNGFMNLPLCQKTYTVYDYNYGRDTPEAVEDHMHHLESLFRYVDYNLFWSKYVGPYRTYGINGGPGDIHRCGNAHYPPNGRSDYDWQNDAYVWSDCEDWKPDGSGEKQYFSCEKWQCHDPGFFNLRFFVWWMQNIPGKGNDLYDGDNKLKNWWDFVGNFDQAIQEGRSLTY